MSIKKLIQKSGYLSSCGTKWIKSPPCGPVSEALPPVVVHSICGGSPTCRSCDKLRDLPCITEIDKGNIVGLLTVDLRKAFGLLNINILLKKLQLYGCSKESVMWFSCYLKARRQIVNVNGLFSEPKKISFGVPQGSILGPLMFLIYINDLPSNINVCDTEMYADDTSLSCFAKSVSDLQTKMSITLDILSKWCRDNCLVINSSKTYFMVLCNRQKRAYLKLHELNLALCNENLVYKDCIKVLGLLIDQNLSWKYHIDFICSKISRLIGLLWRICSNLDKATMILFYNSYILPHLDYAVNIWGGAAKCYVNKLQVLQNRVARIILNENYDTSSHVLLNRLMWMSVRQRYAYQTYILLFKVFHNIVPANLNCFVLNENIYEFRASTKSLLKVPHPRTNIMKTSFACNGSVLWNNLPTDLRCIDNFNIFKKVLKSYIILNVPLA